MYRIFNSSKLRGKIIELQAFMKIKNVKNGYAGLLLRIDGYGIYWRSIIWLRKKYLAQLIGTDIP